MRGLFFGLFSSIGDVMSSRKTESRKDAHHDNGTRERDLSVPRAPKPHGQVAAMLELDEAEIASVTRDLQRWLG
jgi:hypothetical protein